MRCKQFLVHTAALTAILMQSAVYADACNDGDNGERLEHRYSIDTCRKADASLTRRTEEVREGFGPFEDDASWRAWPAKAQRLLQREFAAVEVDRQQAQSTGDATLAARLTQMGERVNAATAQVATVHDLGELGKPTAPADFKDLQVDNWRVRAEPRDRAGELAAKFLDEQHCLDTMAGDTRCDAVYTKAVAIADHSFVVARIVSALHMPLRQELRSEAERRTEAWHAYLYDTQFQYWWELAFNRYLESRCPHGLNAKVAPLIGKQCRARSKDAFGNELGFREPPDYKVTLLHPDIGLMYLDDEPKGDRFKPAVVLQVFGYEWWNAGDGTIRDRRGAALVLSASDNARVHAVGYGLQVRWNSYALAATNHSGKWAFTLNLDLIGRLASANPKWAEEIKLPLTEE